MIPVWKLLSGRLPSGKVITPQQVPSVFWQVVGQVQRLFLDSAFEVFFDAFIDDVYMSFIVRWERILPSGNGMLVLTSLVHVDSYCLFNMLAFSLGQHKVSCCLSGVRHHQYPKVLLSTLQLSRFAHAFRMHRYQGALDYLFIG